MSQNLPHALRGNFRKLLLGSPIPSAREHQERLSVFFGLPVFASDALSSAAYATEAIVGILVLAGTSVIGFQPAITLAICLLYLVVVISYQQTIHAYPSGGGSYIVAADNLGEKPAVIAGSALLIDYILTVAVSIAAGVAALVSAFPGLHSALLPLNVLFIALIAWANLRGVRESGMVFAIPSYAFVLSMVAMIVVGLLKVFGTAHPATIVLGEPGMIGSEANFPLLLILLRSFSAGCVALTGVEAISNGIPAFRPPEAKNAATSLKILAAMMIFMFIGTGYLVQYLPRLALLSTADPQYRTVVSQIAAQAFGAGSIGFFVVQIATAMILILAANTAFADFPRLASILARDGYLPRPLARRGDRLVYQNGIAVLAIFAIALVVYFKGELDLLLPLYAVGVFTAFTLSQTGMVRHWLKLRTCSWLSRTVVSGVGAVTTGVVAVVILVTKFSEGAWMVLLLMGIVTWGLLAVKARYAAIGRQLSLANNAHMETRRHCSIVLVPRVHRGTLEAVAYAKSLHTDVVGLHVALDPKKSEGLRSDWEKHVGDTPLVVIESPYRSLLEPVLQYVDTMLEQDPERVISVVIAEAVALKWRHKLLQENLAPQLKRALGRRKNVVVSNMRYFLH